MIEKKEDGREFIGDIEVTGWSEADQTALCAAISAERSEREAVAQAEAEVAAYHKSPAVIIARKKLQAEEAKAARAMAEQKLIEDQKYDELVSQLGRQKIRRIDTRRGMVVIRSASEKETMEHNFRKQELTTKEERWDFTKRYWLKLCLYPEAPQIQAIANEFPGFWDDVMAVYEDLMTAVDKKDRPTG